MTEQQLRNSIVLGAFFLLAEEVGIDAEDALGADLVGRLDTQFDALPDADEVLDDATTALTKRMLIEAAERLLAGFAL